MRTLPPELFSRPTRTLVTRLAAHFTRLAAHLTLLAALTLWLPTVAHADDGALLEDGISLLRGYSLSVGGFMETGRGELSGWRYDHALAPEAHGVRYFERNGLISGTLAALVMSMAGVKAAYSPTKVEEVTPRGAPIRVTRFTFHGPAERERILAATSNTAARLFGNADQSFDLQIYSRNLGGHSDGWRANLMFIGFARPDSRMLFETGLGHANVTSAVGVNGNYLITQYNYWGMPFRLSVPVGPVVGYLHFDWNWLGHMSDGYSKTVTGGTGGTGGTLTRIETSGFPWRLGAQLAVIGRLYADVAITTPHSTSGEFGLAGSACLKF
jgi:hypothetical protein